MNRYLSTAALAARPTIYKALAITALSALAVGFLLLRLPLAAADETYQAMGAYPYIFPLYLAETASRSGASAACLAGFVALMAVMSLNGCGFGVKTDYTVRRLRLEEWQAELLWAGCYTVCVLLYWAAMAAVCYWAAGRRLALLAADETLAGCFLHDSHARLLTFYASPFFHHLLPLGDLLVWAEDVILAVLCGGAAVRFSRRQRKGHLSLAPLHAVVLTVLTFWTGIGDPAGYLLLLVIIAAAVYNLLRRGEEEDEALVAKAP